MQENTRLILVRHGRTEWNQVRRAQGQTDVPLDAVGREQADRIAIALQEEPIAAVYASDLSRARETAEVVAVPHGLTVTPSPLFREVDFGAWEGMTIPEIERDYPAQAEAWRRDSLRCRPPGGESLEALQERALRGAEEMLTAYPGATILLVAHGGSIRSLLCGLFGWSLSAHRQLRLDNGSITRIEAGLHGPMLVAFNDTCHLRNC